VWLRNYNRCGMFFSCVKNTSSAVYDKEYYEFVSAMSTIASCQSNQQNTRSKACCVNCSFVPSERSLRSNSNRCLIWIESSQFVYQALYPTPTSPRGSLSSVKSTRQQPYNLRPNNQEVPCRICICFSVRKNLINLRARSNTAKPNTC
jgi:hypothetical protein